MPADKTPEFVLEGHGSVSPPSGKPTARKTTARKAAAAGRYRVEIDGETVWSGDGDSYKVIPEEYRRRPDDAAPGDPHPPAHFLYENDELIGVQISQAEEDGQ